MQILICAYHVFYNDFYSVVCYSFCTVLQCTLLTRMIKSVNYGQICMIQTSKNIFLGNQWAFFALWAGYQGRRPLGPA